MVSTSLIWNGTLPLLESSEVHPTKYSNLLCCMSMLTSETDNLVIQKHKNLSSWVHMVDWTNCCSNFLDRMHGFLFSLRALSNNESLYQNIGHCNLNKFQVAILCFVSQKRKRIFYFVILGDTLCGLLSLNLLAYPSTYCRQLQICAGNGR